ncbi:metal-dependent hydrolase [Williamsia sp.]|uniref:metal-dependent hydrolase n=1 Tax=Williamsia sp. TaxID=1872085 RepID=UPI001A295797|nr:metal-dependent hydrolase [Williamsia sp.]MBJ7291072.1 metal-dependent hydrolase [Williamsia sp.]
MSDVSKIAPGTDPVRIRARRISFSYPRADADRHYVGGDLIMSHAVSMLSSVFPEGEDFFVRSVRHYRNDISDPVLQEHVAGFIGQEVTHGREHRNINERLQEMGYPTRKCDRFTKRSLATIYRHVPHRISLAMTAGFEHYTATLAHHLLTDAAARALLTSEEVRKLLLWHAYEEVEHKAVAFDVYRHTGGSERTRIWTMRLINAIFPAFVVASTVVSMLVDRASYRPTALVRSLWALRSNPWLSRPVVAELRTYTRRGFHPDDNPTAELLQQWSTELFGDAGLLADNVGAGAGRRSVPR